MAMSDKDRKQLLGLLIFVSIVATVLFWMYWRAPKVAQAQEMEHQIDSLRARVDSARADLRQGTVEQLRRRVDAYERSLGLMRQLVPTENEVTNLIDEVSTRAQLRGVQITDIAPLPPEYEIPYQVHRYRFSVQGQYDQIGEFLSDVASLPRIMVPYELSLQVTPTVVAEGADEEGTYLQANFLLRSFVKADVDEVFGGANSGG
jgi:type IV pilus assembly protein PilO